uniref:Uncharacterized protein n=1 Tax=Glossina austeni TaxID=7395 RepID=A0A1A9VN70_GLOAU
MKVQVEVSLTRNTGATDVQTKSCGSNPLSKNYAIHCSSSSPVATARAKDGRKNIAGCKIVPGGSKKVKVEAVVSASLGIVRPAVATAGVAVVKPVTAAAILAGVGFIKPLKLAAADDN